MLDKLQALEDRYLDLEAKISDHEVIADQANWLKATKAHAKLEPIVTAYREYRDMVQARDEAQELLEQARPAPASAPRARPTGRRGVRV